MHALPRGTLGTDDQELSNSFVTPLVILLTATTCSVIEIDFVPRYHCSVHSIYSVLLGGADQPLFGILLTGDLILGSPSMRLYSTISQHEKVVLSKISSPL